MSVIKGALVALGKLNNNPKLHAPKIRKPTKVGESGSLRGFTWLSCFGYLLPLYCWAYFLIWPPLQPKVFLRLQLRLNYPNEPTLFLISWPKTWFDGDSNWWRPRLALCWDSQLQRYSGIENDHSNPFHVPVVYGGPRIGQSGRNANEFTSPNICSLYFFTATSDKYDGYAGSSVVSPNWKFDWWGGDVLQNTNLFQKWVLQYQGIDDAKLRKITRDAISQLDASRWSLQGVGQGEC